MSFFGIDVSTDLGRSQISRTRALRLRPAALPVWGLRLRHRARHNWKQLQRPGTWQGLRARQPKRFAHGCWDTFYMFASCGLVGNLRLTARIKCLLPFQRQPRCCRCRPPKPAVRDDCPWRSTPVGDLVLPLTCAVGKWQLESVGIGMALGAWGDLKGCMHGCTR